MSLNIFAKSVPYQGETEVNQFGFFQVNVDATPIGGYRGQAGALIIGHTQHKVIADWSDDDLLQCAHLINKCLDCYKQAGTHNVLLFGKQEKGEFQLRLVPYPKCSLYEKVQGLFHAIFGGKNLTAAQVEEIRGFYKQYLKQEDALQAIQQLTQAVKRIANQCIDNIAFLFGSANKQEAEDKKPANDQDIIYVDPFCNLNVIQKQLIHKLLVNGQTYNLLHDNRPKGRVKEDPHLLIAPEGREGHPVNFEPSKLLQQRWDMLTILRAAFQNLAKENPETLVYLERYGEKLQGVKHTHMHAIGIKQFPKTLTEKIMAFFRLLCPSALSNEKLQERIQFYKNYSWKV